MLFNRALLAGFALLGSLLPTLASHASPICKSGYALVPGNPEYQMSPLCVAQFEMKRARSLPASTPSGLPWNGLTRDDAVTLCNSLGGSYHLLTNAEWQTISRNVESVASNWSSGIAGVGDLNAGNYSTEYGAVTADLNPCATEGYPVRFPNCLDHTSSDFLRKRTHTLSSGDEIWDLGGNSPEWTWTDVGTSTPGDFRGTTCELSGIYKEAYGPSKNYSTNCFFGAHHFGCVEGNGGSLIFRGGASGMEGGPWESCEGIFYVNTNAFWTTSRSGPGFRCAYYPASDRRLVTRRQKQELKRQQAVYKAQIAKKKKKK